MATIANLVIGLTAQAANLEASFKRTVHGLQTVEQATKSLQATSGKASFADSLDKFASGIIPKFFAFGAVAGTVDRALKSLAQQIEEASAAGETFRLNWGLVAGELQKSIYQMPMLGGALHLLSLQAASAFGFADEIQLMNEKTAMFTKDLERTNAAMAGMARAQELIAGSDFALKLATAPDEATRKFLELQNQLDSITRKFEQAAAPFQALAVTQQWAADIVASLERAAATERAAAIITRNRAEQMERAAAAAKLQAEHLSRVEAIEDRILDVQRMIDQFGMTAIEKQLDDLKRLDATTEQLERMREALEQLQELEDSSRKVDQVTDSIVRLADVTRNIGAAAIERRNIGGFADDNMSRNRLFQPTKLEGVDKDRVKQINLAERQLRAANEQTRILEDLRDQMDFEVFSF